MQDKVRTQDYLQYLKVHLLPHWLEMQKDVKKRYTECKEDYENSWFAKLFRLSYENSSAGRNGFWGQWDFHDGGIYSIKEEITRVEYLMKIDTCKVGISNGLSASSFYKWCAENNIPY